MGFELSFSIKNQSGSTSSEHYVVIGRDIRINQDDRLIMFNPIVYFSKAEYANGSDPVRLVHEIGSCEYSEGALESTPVLSIIQDSILAFYKQKFSVDDSKIKIK